MMPLLGCVLRIILQHDEWKSMGYTDPRLPYFKRRTGRVKRAVIPNLFRDLAVVGGEKEQKRGAEMNSA